MKPTAMSRFLIGAGIAVFSYSCATAQTVYRCGPNGNQYSQQPCAQGKQVDVADPRSAQQLDEARKSVIEQRKLGYLMAKQRHEEERAHPARPAGNLGPRPTAAQIKPVSKPKKSAAGKRSGKSALQSAEGSEFVAVAPAIRKKKRGAAEN